MRTEPAWPFGDDADRDDPLTQLRIAVTGSHPGWRYLVAFDRESEDRPTDAEARMLQSYLDEYKAHWYGTSSFGQRLADRELDVDGGANGVVFHKFAPNDWGYRRQSYTMGLPWSVVWPSMRHEYAGTPAGQPYSLAALMDRMHSIATDIPCQRWSDWKAAHPDVFPRAEVTT